MDAQDLTEAPTPSEPQRQSVVERLKAHKAKKLAETPETTLPETGIKVTYPGFVSHDRVMAASKIAGKNRTKVGSIVVAETCRFEGDKLTVDQIASLLPNRDTVHLINLVLGDDDEDDGETPSGN